MLANSLIESDRRHLIHPVSAYRAHEKRGATVLSSARGMYLTDAGGRELLDAFAGLWCVNVGYGQESIVAAASEQMRRLPYATGYFSFASEPAIRLAERLADLSPPGLDRVYFTLGGSDAIDSAIRFIVHYFNATGRPAKKHMIALDKGYHGSSSNGAGLTGLAAFHRQFDVPHRWQHHIPAPYPYRSAVGEDPQAVIDLSIAQLKAKVEELGAENVAAFFAEPVQGSAGVIVPPKGWLKAIREACRELGILFVADEVITGFGRTGPMFACESEGVTPDLMTLAKGLTAGYAPMGAVLMSEEIYAGLADGPDNHLPIGHGQTYSGHPVSAAVGLAVMDLYLQGGILANGQVRARQLGQGLAALADHPLVGNIRTAGMLAGIELVADKVTKTPFAPALDISDRLSRAAYEQRLIFRAFGDGTIGLAPALSCDEEDMGTLLQRLRATLDNVLEQAEVRAAIA
ncbi:MAG: aminotransferase class III-fold pyridoxal phosphate-dependent enzyme [Sphingomonadales bacterium]|nr:aminotransferase class III-fold pyridoxal phosphate-dependent enzyme [Sphingomonadales bacterium]MDE2171002.1 aminotransferase class III-fold pyridoxal phosphate-dependent enzyme [Sphingomonadales bacterium]